MNRKLKALGLALVAVFAMSAVAASGAQATNFFHNHIASVNPDNVIITGENKIGASGVVSTEEFTPAPGSEALKCSSAVVEGTETAGASHQVEDKSAPYTHQVSVSLPKTITGTNLTVTQTLSNCTFAGGVASVSTTGCHYRFTSETSGSGHGGTHIECEAGKSVTISAVGCEIKIGTQTPASGGVSYTNETSVTSSRDIKLKTTIGGVSYTTNGAFSCFLAGIGSGGSAGTTSGELTMKAFEDTTASSTGTYDKGVQVGYWWGPTE
jgi:hypothetical protein